VRAWTAFNTAAAVGISADSSRHRSVIYKDLIRYGVQFRQKRQQHRNVTNHRNG
jgi:hypothetical protein